MVVVGEVPGIQARREQVEGGIQKPKRPEPPHSWGLEEAVLYGGGEQSLGVWEGQGLKPARAGESHSLPGGHWARGGPRRDGGATGAPVSLALRAGFGSRQLGAPPRIPSVFVGARG